MAKATEKALHFRIMPSTEFKAISDAFHGLAILACWWNDLSELIRISLTIAIVILWRLHGNRRNAGPVHLSYTGGEGWRVSLDGEDYMQAVIMNTTVILNAVIFLHFKMENQANRTLLITKGSLANNEFRRLRVKLILSLCGQER
ncbi:protein YgfX [Methylomonas sp. MgM2]